jgi:hypothetical protein
MEQVTLADLDILEVGHTIQLGGAIWTGNGKVYLVPLPDEDLTGEREMLKMDTAQWERFLNQSDVLDVRGPGKAILRKSQRQIDQHVAWKVFRRDGFLCRYCGNERPLTVDHVVLWEQGGATVEDNLVSSCKNCNKLRGSTGYMDWVSGPNYRKAAHPNLKSEVHAKNMALIDRIDDLRKITAKPRSR